MVVGGGCNFVSKQYFSQKTKIENAHYIIFYNYTKELKHLVVVVMLYNINIYIYKSI